MPKIDAHAGGRHDLTDAQWELLAPLLPELPTTGRPRTYGLRGLDEVQGVWVGVGVGQWGEGLAGSVVLGQISPLLLGRTARSWTPAWRPSPPHCTSLSMIC